MPAPRSPWPQSTPCSSSGGVPPPRLSRCCRHCGDGCRGRREKERERSEGRMPATRGGFTFVRGGFIFCDGVSMGSGGRDGAWAGQESGRETTKNREFISDTWGKRGATYGEKGGVSANSKGSVCLPGRRAARPARVRAVEVERGVAPLEACRPAAPRPARPERSPAQVRAPPRGSRPAASGPPLRRNTRGEKGRRWEAPAGKDENKRMHF